MNFQRITFIFVIIVLALSSNLLYASAQTAPRDFYVSPRGSANGNGSFNDPWTLRKALSHPDAVRPGDTIWLLGGTYGNGGSTLFTSRLRGTQDKPIVVRRYPGHISTVNGGIDAKGQWTTFWGFIITNTGPRTVPQHQRPPGLDLNGRGHSAINMIVHNTGNTGIGFWKPVGAGAEIYGSIIWGTGIYQTDNGGTRNNPWMRGSGIYAQNQHGTRYIRETMTFRNLSNGIKMYAVGSHADGFHLEGNVSFENKDYNIVAGAKDNPIQRLVLRDNFTYRDRNDDRRSVRLGLDSTQRDVVVQNNYFVSGKNHPVLDLYRFREFSVTGNTLVSVDELTEYTEASNNRNIWDNNYYHGGDAKAFGDRTLAGWRDLTGFDRNTPYRTNPPARVDVSVRPNAYEDGRGHVIVYNWPNRNQVSVDLSSILDDGDVYEVRDAENLFGRPAAKGIYNGGEVSLPMNLTRTSRIVGQTYRNIHREHTQPEFNVFVVWCKSCELNSRPHNTNAQASASTNIAEQTNLVQNPSFNDGTQHYAFLGQVSRTVNNQTLLINRPVGSGQAIAGQILDGVSFLGGSKLQASVELGNPTSQDKRVVLMLVDPNRPKANDASLVCRFTVPASSPMQPYQLSGVTQSNWNKVAVAAMLNDTTNGDLWVDNVNVLYRPDANISGVACQAPQVSGSTLTVADTAPKIEPVQIVESTQAASEPQPLSLPIALPVQHPTWNPFGGWAMTEAGWQVSGPDASALRVSQPVNLAGTSNPVLHFASSTDGGAFVQVRPTGSDQWTTLAPVSTQPQQAMSLAAYSGQMIDLRWAWAGGGAWTVANVTILDEIGGVDPVDSIHAEAPAMETAEVSAPETVEAPLMETVEVESAVVETVEVEAAVMETIEITPIEPEVETAGDETPAEQSAVVMEQAQISTGE